MKKKQQLILHIICESFITIGMLIDWNLWAVAGWGFLALSNVTNLMKLIIEENKNPNANPK